MMENLKKSYSILDRVKKEHGLFLASPSPDYSDVWIRDSFYMALPYLNKSCDTYEKVYHAFFDIFKRYKHKIEHHTRHKPVLQWEYIHAKYDANTLEEIDKPWGHAQHDAIGAVLWGIAKGLDVKKPIFRDSEDKEITLLLVHYLGCCEYWSDPDNGMWEENREVHSSSVGACVAGLKEISRYLFFPWEYIEKGEQALFELLPRESKSKAVDLAQLSLIYPYNVVPEELGKLILQNVTTNLLRERGVIRYEGDSYYSTLEQDYGREHSKEFFFGTEAEWTFGIPWIALCSLHYGYKTIAEVFVNQTEKLMLEDGSLPELYFAGTDLPNPNTPLGWSSAMYILAKEGITT